MTYRLTRDLVLAVMLSLLSAQADSSTPQGGTIGINGAPCAFNTIESAVQAASSGDTLYVRPSFRTEYIGKIDIDLTLVQSMPSPIGCEQENPAADAADLTITAKSFSHDSTGGLGEIRQGAQVTFRNMTLTNATAVNGGILAVTGGSMLTLDNVHIHTGSASGHGGLIHVAGSTGAHSVLEVLNGSLLAEGQSDGNGGAIHAVDADLTLDTAMIRDNQAALLGGGLFLEDGSLQVLGSVFEDNDVTTAGINLGGGAMALVDQDNVLISQSQFISNGSASDGGALRIDSSINIRIENNTLFQANAADGDGGAIRAFLGFAPEALQLSDVHFENNIAGFNGGAVWLGLGSLRSSDQSTFINNRARTGGALFLNPTSSLSAVIDATTFQFNQAFGVTADEGEGGAIAMRGSSTLIISNSLIDQNQADFRGGGLFLFSASSTGPSLTLSNSALTGNLADDGNGTGSGGGMYLNNGEQVVLTDLLIQSNQAAQSGGGAFLISVDDARISSSQVNANLAGRGAGVYILGGQTLIDSGSSLTGNLALSGSGIGGGLYYSGGNLRLNDVLIEDNQAISGGGIYQFTGALTVENTRISDNQATIIGGGIRSTFGDLLVHSVYGTGSGRCDPSQLPANRYCMEIIGNSAGESGGGIALGADSGSTSTVHSKTIEQTALLDNQATLAGSALRANMIFEANLLFRNLLIAGNGNAIDASSVIDLGGEYSAQIDSVTVASNFGAPLVADDTLMDLSLTNSILFDNTLGPDVAFTVPFVRFCNNAQTGTGQSMGGNLGDPGFVSTARGDYRLNMSSASANQCTSGPLQDLDGLYRIDALFDQGAFDHQAVSTLPDALFSDGFE